MGPLAPVTLLGGRRLGDDTHAGTAAAHVAAAGGTEATTTAAATIAEAAAVAAAPTHAEAATPAVACAPGGGDHSCGEKTQGTVAGPSGFPGPTLPRSGGSFPRLFLKEQESLQSPGCQGLRGWALPQREHLLIGHQHLSNPFHNCDHADLNRPERMPLLCHFVEETLEKKEIKGHAQGHP